MAKSPYPLAPSPRREAAWGGGSERMGLVAGGEAARHQPPHAPFSPRFAGREGGRGMSGVLLRTRLEDFMMY